MPTTTTDLPYVVGFETTDNGLTINATAEHLSVSNSSGPVASAIGSSDSASNIAVTIADLQAGTLSITAKNENKNVTNTNTVNIDVLETGEVTTVSKINIPLASTNLTVNDESSLPTGVTDEKTTTERYINFSEKAASGKYIVKYTDGTEEKTITVYVAGEQFTPVDDLEVKTNGLYLGESATITICEDDNGSTTQLQTETNENPQDDFSLEYQAENGTTFTTTIDLISKPSGVSDEVVAALIDASTDADTEVALGQAVATLISDTTSNVDMFKVFDAAADTGVALGTATTLDSGIGIDLSAQGAANIVKNLAGVFGSDVTASTSLTIIKAADGAELDLNNTSNAIYRIVLDVETSATVKLFAKSIPNVATTSNLSFTITKTSATKSTVVFESALANRQYEFDGTTTKITSLTVDIPTGALLTQLGSDGLSYSTRIGGATIYTPVNKVPFATDFSTTYVDAETALPILSSSLGTDEGGGQPLKMVITSLPDFATLVYEGAEITTIDGDGLTIDSTDLKLKRTEREVVIDLIDYNQAPTVVPDWYTSLDYDGFAPDALHASAQFLPPLGTGDTWLSTPFHLKIKDTRTEAQISNWTPGASSGLTSIFNLAFTVFGSTNNAAVKAARDKYQTQLRNCKGIIFDDSLKNIFIKFMRNFNAFSWLDDSFLPGTSRSGLEFIQFGDKLREQIASQSRNIPIFQFDGRAQRTTKISSILIYADAEIDASLFPYIDASNFSTGTPPPCLPDIPETSFKFKVSDGLDKSSEAATYTIEFNKRPTANNATVDITEGQTVTITLTASDPDGDPLTYELVDNTLPGHITASLTGTTLTITASTESTTHKETPFVVPYKVNDGQLDSAPASVTVNYIPVNDSPIIAPIDLTANPFKASLLMTEIEFNATDEEGDHLTFSFASTESVSKQESLGLSIDTNQPRLKIDLTKPTYKNLRNGETLTVTVNMEVSDGEHTVSFPVTYMVTGVQDEYTITVPTDLGVTEKADAEDTICYETEEFDVTITSFDTPPTRIRSLQIRNPGDVIPAIRVTYFNDDPADIIDKFIKDESVDGSWNWADNKRWLNEFTFDDDEYLLGVYAYYGRGLLDGTQGIETIYLKTTKRSVYLNESDASLVGANIDPIQEHYASQNRPVGASIEARPGFYIADFRGTNNIGGDQWTESEGGVPSDLEIVTEYPLLPVIPKSVTTLGQVNIVNQSVSQLSTGEYKTTLKCKYSVKKEATKSIAGGAVKTDTFEVLFDGATKDLNIDITGADDTATVTTTVKGTGTYTWLLTVKDVDNTYTRDDVTLLDAVGTYGSFTVEKFNQVDTTASMCIKYTPDKTLTAYKKLSQGEKGTDTCSVKIAGSTKSYTAQVEGVNDLPVVKNSGGIVLDAYTDVIVIGDTSAKITLKDRDSDKANASYNLSFDLAIIDVDNDANYEASNFVVKYSRNRAGDSTINLLSNSYYDELVDRFDKKGDEDISVKGTGIPDDTYIGTITKPANQTVNGKEYEALSFEITLKNSNGESVKLTQDLAMDDAIKIDENDELEFAAVPMVFDHTIGGSGNEYTIDMESNFDLDFIPDGMYITQPVKICVTGTPNDDGDLAQGDMCIMVLGSISSVIVDSVTKQVGLNDDGKGTVTFEDVITMQFSDLRSYSILGTEDDTPTSGNWAQFKFAHYAYTQFAGSLRWGRISTAGADASLKIKSYENIELDNGTDGVFTFLEFCATLPKPPQSYMSVDYTEYVFALQRSDDENFDIDDLDDGEFIAFRVYGNDNKPVISSSENLQLTEDTNGDTISTSGCLTFTDVDYEAYSLSDITTSAPENAIGELTITAVRSQTLNNDDDKDDDPFESPFKVEYTYTADGSSSKLCALNKGDIHSEEWTISIGKEGNKTDEKIEIRIEGVSNPPELVPISDGVFLEDSTNKTFTLQARACGDEQVSFKIKSLTGSVVENSAVCNALNQTFPFSELEKIAKNSLVGTSEKVDGVWQQTLSLARAQPLFDLLPKDVSIDCSITYCSIATVTTKDPETNPGPLETEGTIRLKVTGQNDAPEINMSPIVSINSSIHESNPYVTPVKPTNCILPGHGATLTGFTFELDLVNLLGISDKDACDSLTITMSPFICDEDETLRPVTIISGSSTTANGSTINGTKATVHMMTMVYLVQIDTTPLPDGCPTETEADRYVELKSTVTVTDSHKASHSQQLCLQLFSLS